MLITEDNIKRYILTHIEGKHPPKETLFNYRLKNNSKYLKQLNAQYVKSFNKNTVVFISDRPNFFFLRVSKALMDKGVNTVLLTRWGVDKGHSNYFNEVFLFNSLLDLYLLSHIKDVYIYVQSWVGWFFLPVFVDLITKSQVYCNVNDSSVLLFDEISSFNKIGINKDSAVLDIECEIYIYENLNLVTHPYKDINLINNMSVRGGLHYFPCYPLKEFIYNINNPILDKTELVFIGGIPYDKKDDLVFEDAKMHNVAKIIIKQKLHLTILNNPLLTQSECDIAYKYLFFSDLSKNNSNFNFSSGYPPWEIHEYTQNFSYGIMIYDFSNILVSRLHTQSIVPTKFFTYIELGLPVIVSDEMEAVSKIVKDNNIGIVVNWSEVDSLSEIIEQNKISYFNYRQSVNSYALKHSMQKMLLNISSFLM